MLLLDEVKECVWHQECRQRGGGELHPPPASVIPPMNTKTDSSRTDDECIVTIVTDVRILGGSRRGIGREGREEGSLIPSGFLN